MARRGYVRREARRTPLVTRSLSETGTPWRAQRSEAHDRRLRFHGVEAGRLLGERAQSVDLRVDLVDPRGNGVHDLDRRQPLVRMAVANSVACMTQRSWV